MGRARQHHGQDFITGRTTEQHSVISIAPADGQHGGMVSSMHSHEAKHVCSAILQHLESAGPNTPPSVCTLKQLKDLFTACRTDTEAEEGAVHVALMALEHVGAVTRLGYGPDALYALKSKSTSQTWSCPDGTSMESFSPAEGPIRVSPKASHAPKHHEPVAWHILKGRVDVKIPLLQLESGAGKGKLPTPVQRETRGRKGTVGISRS